jgi:hypothetical protein
MGVDHYAARIGTMAVYELTFKLDYSVGAHHKQRYARMASNAEKFVARHLKQLPTP